MKPLLALALCVAMAGAGCAAKNTYTNLPPNVTNAQVNAWVSANDDLVALTSVTDGATKAVIAAHNASGPNGSIFPDGPAYVATLNALGRVIQLKIQAEEFLQAVPNDFGQPVATQIATFATQIASQLSTAQGMAASGITDPTTSAGVVKAITGVVSIVAQIQALVASIKAASLYELPRCYEAGYASYLADEGTRAPVDTLGILAAA